MSLCFLTAGRINEVLRVTKGQFDFESEEDFIVLRNFYVSKRADHPLIDLPIPNNEDARLYPFTELFLNYWDLITERNDSSKLFGFWTRRAEQIFQATCGLFPHSFRAYAETYWVNVLKSATITAKIYGIKNPRTIAHYYKGTWRDFKEAFLK